MQTRRFLSLIVQRSKCWQQEAMGMAKATRRLWLWSRLQLLPAPPAPAPRTRALGAAAAPAPLPAPSGYHTGERPRNRDRWRVGQSPRSLATEPACQRQRYSWTLALPAARKGLRADTARTSEQQARQSSDTALATRAAPTPCAGPRDREREQRTDAAPAARRAAPGAAGGLPRLRGGSPARSPRLRQRRRRSDRQSEPELWSEVLLL